jgi:hypothetical protein
MILIRASDVTKRQVPLSAIFTFTGICDGPGSTYMQAPQPDGECFATTEPFLSVALYGEWLGWRIFSDSGCNDLATIIEVSGSNTMENCYLIEGNGGGSWSWAA